MVVRSSCRHRGNREPAAACSRTVRHAPLTAMLTVCQRVVAALDSKFPSGAGNRDTRDDADIINQSEMNTARPVNA